MATRSSSPVKEFAARSRGWSGGANMRDARTLMPLNQALKIENGVIDEVGSFSKRLGCESHGTFGVGADRALSLYPFYRAGLAPQVLMHTTGGKLYYTDDPWANPVVWTQIVAGLSTTAKFSFETFNSKCYMSNGVDDYASWNGAARTAFASAPKGKFLRIWKDTMFMSGITGLPDRVYESAPGDPETWPVSGWIDIGKGDGDESRALASDGYSLIFFKRQKHVAITDPVTLINRVVDYEKGCESHFSVVQAEGSIYFLSRLGICKYYGDAPSKIISGDIDPLFDPNILNLNALDTAWAYTKDNRIGWALPESGGTLPTMQIEGYPRLSDPQRGVDMPFVVQRMPANVFVRVRYQNREDLFGGKIGANKFLLMYANTGTDDGAAFRGLLETRATDFDVPQLTKYLRLMRVTGRGRFQIQIKRNFQTSIYKTKVVDMTSGSDLWSLADTWNTGTWGPDSLFKEIQVRPDAYARFFTFVFSDDETGTGNKEVNVGSLPYTVPAGEWAIYQIIYEGNILGVRD